MDTSRYAMSRPMSLLKEATPGQGSLSRVVVISSLLKLSPERLLLGINYLVAF